MSRTVTNAEIIRGLYLLRRCFCDDIKQAMRLDNDNLYNELVYDLYVVDEMLSVMEGAESECSQMNIQESV